MTDTFNPWDVYPSLTQERLSIVAEVIREARRGTRMLYDPLGGDDGWSHECRAYRRSCFAITQAAKSYEWLRIVPEPELLKFSFAIESVTLRFYHGTADDQPSHYSSRTDGEAYYVQLALKMDGMPPLDRILRLAVETDADREVSRIILVESDTSRNVTNLFVIQPALAAAGNVVPAQSVAIDLPAPTLEALERQEEPVIDETKKKNG